MSRHWFDNLLSMSNIKSTNKLTKTEKIDIRASYEQKELLKKAAQRLGLSLSQYVLSKALESALSEVSVVEQEFLSESDWCLLLDALDNPPAPNETLKSAFS